MTALPPLPEGTLIDHYRLGQVRTADPVCLIYDAHDLELDLTVAVEEFAPAHLAERAADGAVVIRGGCRDEAENLRAELLYNARRLTAEPFIFQRHITTPASTFLVWRELGPPGPASRRLRRSLHPGEDADRAVAASLAEPLLTRLGELRRRAGRSRFVADRQVPTSAAGRRSHSPVTVAADARAGSPEPHDAPPVKVGGSRPAARPALGFAAAALAGASALAIALVAWSAAKNQSPVVIAPAPPALRAPARRPELATDWVDISLFAPARLPTDAPSLLQLFLHVPDDAAIVAQRARDSDPDATSRGVGSLIEPIPRGTALTLVLEAKDFAVEPAVQTLVWNGRATGCQFTLTHTGAPAGHAIVTAIVLREGAPIGRLSARLALAEPAEAVDVAPTLQDARARRYRTAFLSYSSQDRGDVLQRTHALRAVGIRCFQDVLDLVPGERWPARLREEVESADLFLLFWSQAARASPHVREEIGWALARRAGGDTPEIRPILLEGPPAPAPPDELADMHFDDPLCYVMSAWAARPS